MADIELDNLCINTIRFLAADTVQRAILAIRALQWARRPWPMCSGTGS